MKHGWIVLGLFLILVVAASSLICLLAQGAFTMSIPWVLLFWLWIFGIFALAGGIARAAGWLPQKKQS